MVGGATLQIPGASFDRPPALNLWSVSRLSKSVSHFQVSCEGRTAVQLASVGLPVALTAVTVL